MNADAVNNGIDDSDADHVDDDRVALKMMVILTIAIMVLLPMTMIMMAMKCDPGP